MAKLEECVLLLTEEPILMSDENRYVMFPIRYDDIWQMYEKQVDCFWRPQEIDLTKDTDHWNNLLLGDERYFISMRLLLFLKL